MLKIADMGQSRILQAGQTGMDTGTMGGTMGWMSPEEIKWENARRAPPLALVPLASPPWLGLFTRSWSNVPGRVGTQNVCNDDAGG